jgi:hypothetical protein
VPSILANGARSSNRIDGALCMALEFWKKDPQGLISHTKVGAYLKIFVFQVVKTRNTWCLIMAMLGLLAALGHNRLTFPSNFLLWLTLNSIFGSSRS